MKRRSVSLFRILLAAALLVSPATAQVYQQAPELAAQVAAGLLPPAEQRLPQNPILVEPVEVLGRYGGTWHMAMRRSRDHASFIRTLGYENLVRWSPDWTAVLPNVAQSLTASADAREFTFVLRRGMRWSDGAPFTADDILFWYQDVLMEPALTETIPVWLQAAGRPPVVEKIDEATVRFRFAQPNSLFLRWLAAPEGAEPTSYPAHKLRPLHPRYNPALRGNPAWADGFRAAFGIPGSIDDPSRWAHPDMPTLNAWLLTGVHGVDNPVVAVRNPYYWKIDPAGRQLPYIERIEYAVVEDARAAADEAIAGRVDMQVRHIVPYAAEILAARPDLQEIQYILTAANTLAVSLNLTHRDPVLREVFNQRDFRIALSLALDRERMGRKLYPAGTAVVPWQAAPLPQSRYFHERLATQYLQHDDKAAGALLDGLGYRRASPDGPRLGPDGQAIAFELMAYTESRMAILEMVAEDWRGLGLEVAPTLVDREEFVRRLNANEFDATGLIGDGGIETILIPDIFLPMGIDSTWGLPWMRWYVDRDDPAAEVPPAPVQRQYALFEAIKRTTDAVAQEELMRQILDIAAEEFFVIGTFRTGYETAIVRRGFRNVPRVIRGAWVYPDPAPTNPAQYFIESENLP